MQGLPTGFDYLDKMLLGMGPGDMIVIAARPGLGKTSIGIQIIGHLAVEKKVPCAIFTLEMTAEQLAARLLFQHAKADFQRYRSGYLENEDMPKLIDANTALVRAPILLDETAGINVLQLRARARRFHHQHKIGCLLVDYIQLMRPSRFYQNREQEVAEISGGLKSLAKELQIPVIVLAQLNRDIEKSHNRRPQLADLRESGAIEQDADVVAMLYQPKLDDAEQKKLAAERTDWSDHCRPINLLIAKQRNGPTGDCRLLYQKKSMRFESLYDTTTNPSADACTDNPEREDIP
jgi:replicative DNA helicase